MEFITILGRNAAVRASGDLKTSTAIISIRDINSEKPCFAESGQLVDVLYLEFNDVTGREPGCMSGEDAERVREFVLRVAEHARKLIVHCELGVSRSAGVAAAIRKYLFEDDRDIWESGRFDPNKHCYRLVLDTLRGESSGL